MNARLLAGAAAFVGLAQPALAPQAWAQAPGQASAVIDTSCDRQCLFGFAESYMAALVAKDPSRAAFAADAVFSENNVVLPVGQGLWRSVSGVHEGAMTAADAETGNVAWFGTIEEHGNPAYYAMRLKVVAGAIAEAETVVTRNPDMPKPFGDPDAVNHDPLFNEDLPPEYRRPRERLRAIADGYFDTVELNDGQIFTHFTDDCARLENGVETTAGAIGAASTATGCENQFKLGIYRINKRVRERMYPLIDVERGIVVGSGFFDHANTFDEYLLTDGRTMQTVLKWPNSITLLEAFRIEDGAIDRIEAVFTYVPYFMHNPFAQPGHVPPPERASGGAACDAACLTALATQYMDALDAQDPSLAPWADNVRYSENNVPMMIGDSLWGADPAYLPPSLVIPDPETGSVFWYGIVTEHGQHSYYAMRLTAHDGKIAAAETMLARTQNPGPFADAAAYAIDPVFAREVPARDRTPAARMRQIVDMYLTAQQQFSATGAAAPDFARDCVIVENGEALAHGADATCSDLFMNGAFAAIETVRDRTIVAVDEARGLVAVSAYQDKPSVSLEAFSDIQYPNSRGLMQVFKIADGEILRVEGVSAFLPYGMPAPE